MFPAVSTPTLLASFTTSTGSIPLGSVSIAGGLLYGTTQQGGTNNVGTVFSVSTTGVGSDTLAFNEQPEGGVVNADIGQVTVLTETSAGDGTTDASNTATVQLSIASGPAGAVLSGNVYATVSSAEATFNGLSVNLPGTYALLARDIADTPGTSSSCDVIRDDTLVFTVVPTTAVADSPIGNVVVQVNNHAGGVDTTYNGPVTVCLTGSDRDRSGGHCQGNRYNDTVNAVNGVATLLPICRSMPRR